MLFCKHFSAMQYVIAALPYVDKELTSTRSPVLHLPCFEQLMSKA